MPAAAVEDTVAVSVTFDPVVGFELETVSVVVEAVELPELFELLELLPHPEISREESKATTAAVTPR